MPTAHEFYPGNGTGWVAGASPSHLRPGGVYAHTPSAGWAARAGLMRTPSTFSSVGGTTVTVPPEGLCECCGVRAGCCLTRMPRAVSLLIEMDSPPGCACVAGEFVLNYDPSLDGTPVGIDGYWVSDPIPGTGAPFIPPVVCMGIFANATAPSCFSGLRWVMYCLNVFISGGFKLILHPYQCGGQLSTTVPLVGTCNPPALVGSGSTVSAFGVQTRYIYTGEGPNPCLSAPFTATVSA